MSLKPNFAERILTGHKTAEVRRRFPNLPPATLVFVYASSPTREVVGSFRLDAVHVAPPAELWDQFGDRLDISRAYFDEYLLDRKGASILEVGHVSRWKHAVPLARLRTDVRVEPPQSYRYLSAEQVSTLRAAAEH